MIYGDYELEDILRRNSVNSAIVGEKAVLEEIGVANINLFHIDDNMLAYAREAAITLSSKINDQINTRIKETLVDGFRVGEGAGSLTKRIQNVFDEGMTINVPPSLDANGNVIREGYSYFMPNKRWAETVARTEPMRWANEGRLDG